MSATDPLREALERIAALKQPSKSDGLAKARQIARAALAAVPAEPDQHVILEALDSHGLEANPIGTRAALAAVSKPCAECHGEGYHCDDSHPANQAEPCEPCGGHGVVPAEARPVEARRNHKRAAFLAGEGTMDAAEVWVWAAEYKATADGGIESDEPLMVSVVRPAEPEAWEWRAVVEGHRRTPYRSAAQDERSARDFAADLARDIPHGVVSVERRTAPGPWERVDPEPREPDDDNDEPRWLHMEDLPYHGGGVMSRRRVDPEPRDEKEHMTEPYPEVRRADAEDARRDLAVRMFKRCVRAAGITTDYDADIEHMEHAIIAFADEWTKGSPDPEPRPQDGGEHA